MIVNVHVRTLFSKALPGPETIHVRSFLFIRPCFRQKYIMENTDLERGASPSIYILSKPDKSLPCSTELH